MSRKLGNLGFQPFGPPDFQKLEESASHHVLDFAIAQLRAETAKNAALGPQRFPEIRKIINFRPPEKSHFDKLSDPFAYNFEL